MNNNTILHTVLFAIEMPKDHFDKLVSLFECLTEDLRKNRDVTYQEFIIFNAFLEAMKNK